MTNLSNPNQTKSPWTDGICIMHAADDCKTCEGLGRTSTGSPCACVLREVFDRVFSAVTERNETLGNNPFLNINYSVDFSKLVKSTLSPADYHIFGIFHVQGVAGHTVAEKLGMTKSRLFHATYRIEAAIGRALVERQPVPLYPFANYFHTTKGSKTVALKVRTAAPAANILRPPMALGSAA